jgi:hypothetical protein
MPNFQHTKASRIEIQNGVPSPVEGNNGELRLGITAKGIFLFTKYGNRWYQLNDAAIPAGGNFSTRGSSGSKGGNLATEIDRSDESLKMGGSIMLKDNIISNNGEATGIKFDSSGNVVVNTQSTQVGTNGYMTFTDNEIDISSGDLTLDVAGNITIDADGGTFSINDTAPAAFAPSILVTSTDAGAGGPIQVFKQDSASPAIGDVLGQIFFQGDDSGGNVTGYASIQGKIENPTGGSEEGKLVFLVSDGSTSQIGYQMTGNSGKVDVNVGHGASSTTTVAGDLDIDGSQMTTAGSFEIDTTGHFVLDSGNDITLDSNSGNFIAKKAGTEFSAANSAYAGMILGYTNIGLNEVHATHNLTTSYTVPTDEFSVSFTAPPSGNVEIYMQIWFNAGSTGLGDLYAGLSTANATSGYSALQDYHEEVLIDGSGRSSFEVTSNLWTLTGLTAGTNYEYWVGFKSSSTSGTPYLRWGGNATGRNPDFIMKATALPETITT